MAARISVIEDTVKILEFLENKSDTMADYIKENLNDRYILMIKNISHSDLISSGKRTKVTEPFFKNYLYYLTVDEMEEIDRINPRPFVTAHQSNIGIPKQLVYDFLEVENPNEEGEKHFLINGYADVYLINDTLKYFNIDYTFDVLEKLDKVPNWNKDDYRLNLQGKMTEISLSIAAHGIGVAFNKEFQKLRRSIFKSDSLIILLNQKEKSDKKNIFIMLEKNPKFFTLVGEGNKSWEKYLQLHGKEQLYELLKKKSLSSGEFEKTRKNQNKWRNMLADEMMSYTTTDNEIFCPLTYITANYSTVGTLFRASHIKPFNECTIDEAFDINNGILMVANADALFDKHLITIDDNGKIIFSFLIAKEHLLKNQLRLTEDVFKAILNPQRKKYLKRHREIFEGKELKRKYLSDFDDDISE